MYYLANTSFSGFSVAGFSSLRTTGLGASTTGSGVEYLLSLAVI